MTGPERPPGSHRRVRDTNRIAVLIASLVGIAIAAILVSIALQKRGEPAHNTAPASSPNPLEGHSPLGSASPPESQAAPSSAPVSPSVSPPPSSSAPVSPPPAATSGAASQTSSAPAPLPALDVLNDSRITGLAARASATFRAAGWNVATVGNFRGPDVPETTVFYPDGERAAADRLAAAFGIDRVRLATSELSSANLTVALARDWARDH